MATISSWKYLDERFWLCPICLEILKQPKLLPCLHRYCSNCLNTLLQESDKIACPVCRAKVDVPFYGVAGFKTDVLIMSLIENAQLRQSRKTYKIRKCEGCLKMGEVEAYCLTCNGFLCAECSTFHSSKTIFKHHEKQTLSHMDIESTSIATDYSLPILKVCMCPDHPGCKAEFYCESCDTPVCKACVVGAHKGHDHFEVITPGKRKSPSSFYMDVDTNLLLCEICLELLKDAKLLPCYHRICGSCLNCIIWRSKDVFICPTCRHEAPIPKCGIEGFKTDFYVKSLIENIYADMASPHRMTEILPPKYSGEFRGDWQVSDISSYANEGFIVAGYSRQYRQTSIDVISREQTVIFEIRFTHKGDVNDRFIAAFNSGELVTGCGRKVQVIRTGCEGTIQSTYTLQCGLVSCLAVSSSKSIIYVGRVDSRDILVLGQDMKFHQTLSISTENVYGITDVAALNDTVIACYAGVPLMSNGKVIMVDVASNKMIVEYNTILGDDFCPKSITFNEDKSCLLILWSSTSASGYNNEFEHHITVHRLDIVNDYCQAVYGLTPPESARKVAALYDNILVIVDSRGTATTTNMAEFFNFGNFLKSLSKLLLSEHCVKLSKHFGIFKQRGKSYCSRNPGKWLLITLEEKRIVSCTDVISLRDAFERFSMTNALHLVEGYLTKTRSPLVSTFENFIAQFSTFLTSNLFEAMCEHFKISSSDKSEMLLTIVPGLSLLATLTAEGIIAQTNVRALEIPAFVHLKQVAAMITTYERDTRESKMSSQKHPPELTAEEKDRMFTKYLHRNIKRWYESICPLPWKKVSQWDMSDLFVKCGLIVTRTKCQTALDNIDPNCYVGYSDIFTHTELMDAPRVVVEGAPGTGKTVLAFQIAYDWMNGKFKDIKYAILLQLKYVKHMTIPEAITKLILPVESLLTKADVEDILAATDHSKVCIILDGLGEYTGRGEPGEGQEGGTDTDPTKSEVMKVMYQEKLPKCKVIITTRSEHLQDLPKCPMLKIRLFGCQERLKYVEKILPHNIDKQQDVIMAVETNPLLLDLCDVPLLFVIAVHNIERLTKLSKDAMLKVTPFVRSIVEMLCTMKSKGTRPQNELKGGMKVTFDREGDTINSNDSENFRLSLEEIAFNGLCNGKQQLSWPMHFVQDYISNAGSWIDSGILIIEEEVKRIHRDIRTAMAGTDADYNILLDKKEQVVLTREDAHDTGQTLQFDGPIQSHADGAISVEDQEQTLASMNKRRIFKNGISVLQARFPHKVIQEWFAAKYLANFLDTCNQDEVDRCLNLISPFELHHILLFACGISDKATPLILTHLQRCIHRLDENKQKPVSDCFCRCFLEHKGDRELLKKPVKDFCKRGITLLEEDSRQIQKAKISLLNFTSENKMLVLKVKLVEVCTGIKTNGNFTRLYLSSGLYLNPPQGVHSFMIISRSPKLEDFDYNLLMKYLGECTALQEADLRFPVPPPTLQKKEKISLKNKRVTWSTGQITYHLDKVGIWQLEYLGDKDFSLVAGHHEGQSLQETPKTMQLSMGANLEIFMEETRKQSANAPAVVSRKDNSNVPKKSLLGAFFDKVWSPLRIISGKEETGTTGSLLQTSFKDNKQSSDISIHYHRLGESVTCHLKSPDAKALEVCASVSQKGGAMHIENSEVALLLPPNAFHDEYCVHFIEMRIIPHCVLHRPATSFTECSTVMVELLPNNLSLRNPAVLTLPHCLVLKDCDKCKVRIFTSHHSKGNNPIWEEITDEARYILTQSHCKIWLQRFCWVKYTIGDEEVEAKKLILYTAGRKYKPEAKRVTIDVGYYPQLPGENEHFLEKSKNQIIGCTQFFIFRRIPKDDLCITFKQATPDTWKIRSPLSEAIQYSTIESSCEQSCFFTFLRGGGGDAGLPQFSFRASQGERYSPLTIDMEHEAIETSTTSDGQAKLDSRIYEQQKRNVNVATSLHWNNEGDYSIQPQLEPFSQCSNIPMMPHGEHAVVPVSSFKQFSYQHRLLSSGMSNLLLDQYPTGMVSAVQYPSLPLYGSHLSQEEMFPLSCELLNELELKLGVTDTVNGDWRILAEKLGFKEDEVTYLKTKDVPTIEVLHVAFRRGSFKTLDDLIPILTEMRRIDVVRILTKHKKNTEVSNVNESF